MKDLKKELKQMKKDFDIIQKVECTKEEIKEFKKLTKEKKPLPDGVFIGDMADDYYRVIETDLTHEEIQELLEFRKLSYILTIKNSILFFVVLTLIGMVGAFILSTMGI